MLNDQILILSGVGAGIGFVHTLLGPDHYVPFVFMARARNWKIQRTIFITLLCGLGHVASSVFLGFVGLGIGRSVEDLVAFESSRGNWAAWAFAIFGVVYMTWGIYRAYKNKPHKHLHKHGGLLHTHEHEHSADHDHMHKAEKYTNLTPWVLFVIFVLGPCEPLIPTIIYPALNERGSIAEAVIVSLVFTIVTLVTMVAMVVLLQKGMNIVQLKKMERYSHAIAGAMLLISGIGILFLGL